METYEIKDTKEFNAFVHSEWARYDKNASQGLKFKKLIIIVKEWRKPKTPSQHKYFFVCANEFRKALMDAGTVKTKDETVIFLKLAAGFSETVELPGGRIIEIPKSIADASKDVNSPVMSNLIEFTIEYARQNLNYHIEDPRSKL